MSEDEYRDRLWRERTHGLNAVSAMTLQWRRELWPDRSTDPISRDERRARMRRELAIEGYWGAGINRRLMYGGICA